MALELAGHRRLILNGIDKRYPGGVHANRCVDLEVKAGEIHALLGENGAGKSTLVKIIYGLLQPDAGDIVWQDQHVTIDSPKSARALGIGMVFQHFSLFEAMSVQENIALGLDEPAKRRGLTGRIKEISRAYGLPLDPFARIADLSVGERQRVEIVRCLLQDPRLLIMDEPTSVLTPQEVELLFATLRTLAAEGVSILYISHKLYEIVALCDRATILRQGAVIATCDPKLETPRSMAAKMIGSELKSPGGQRHAAKGDVVFAVRDLGLAAANPLATALRGISFEVRAGEVFGIAGVAGNGQSELFAALSGERLTGHETIAMDGRAIGSLMPQQRRLRGLAAVPEERNGHAAVGDMSLIENAALSGYGPLGLVRHGLMSFAGARAFAHRVVEAFDVRTAGVEHAAKSLSGGNLQKFVVGRELLLEPGVLIAEQPTWGVDAGAAQRIHEALLAMADRGAAIVVISQDLDELFLLADRLAVINGGRLSEAMDIGEADAERLGLLMGGVHGVEPEQRGWAVHA
ncbi:MAG: ABC transporter ATP-binding protein [Geminicoccaceae bacterium]